MSLANTTQAVADFTRPCVNFLPSIWGDLFLTTTNLPYTNGDQIKKRFRPFLPSLRLTDEPITLQFHLAVNDSLLFAVNHLLPFSLLFLRLSSIVQSPFLRFPSVNRSVRVKQSPFKSFGSGPLRRKHCIQVILLCFSPAFLIATFGAISLCVLRHRHIADIDTIRYFLVLKRNLWIQSFYKYEDDSRKLACFPNPIPNPEDKTTMKAITKAVLDNKADLGIIVDTDVGQSDVVDSTGREFNQNRLIVVMETIVLEGFQYFSLKRCIYYA
ncbi:phosphoglucosamine mutase family protein [Trifolium repens]|nr:phosphoglucosamine mutase family protein [Trifolium repens]